MKSTEPRYYTGRAGNYTGVYDRKSPTHRSATGHACISLFSDEGKAADVAADLNRAEKPK